MIRVAAYASILVAVAAPACGGGGEEEVPAEIFPEAAYAARCQTPRKGTDPLTKQAFPDESGSLLDEQLWLRSWTNDLYLWYSEVPSSDPRKFPTALDYFNVLKTNAITASGKPKDQFHFTYTTSDWDSLSTSGVEAGYGITWALLASAPPRKLVVAYVEPGSPADLQHVVRGADIRTIDGVDLVNDDIGNDIDTLNNGIYPTDINQPHTFTYVNPGQTDAQTVTLTSASISINPARVVPLAAPNAAIGYLLFTDHIATAEKALVDSVNQLKTAGITDLVLDLRYNGGGYLDIASELAFMIAGPTATTGKFFEKEQFNNKHPTTDPVTGAALTPTPYATQSEGFSVDPGMALPTLNLTRVFILTGPGTCSASEAVMNGLAGAGLQVIQIGDTTCGKPYGFYPQDNCGTTYFAIQFQGVNNDGFGDYADGFTPGGHFSGCLVDDDFTHQLGDPAEARLAAAIALAAPNGACPAARTDAANPLLSSGGASLKPPWRMNRLFRR